MTPIKKHNKHITDYWFMPINKISMSLYCDNCKTKVDTYNYYVWSCKCIELNIHTEKFRHKISKNYLFVKKKITFSEWIKAYRT